MSKEDREFIKKSRDDLLRKRQAKRDDMVAKRLENQARGERQRALDNDVSDMELENFAQDFLGVSWGDINKETGKHVRGIDAELDKAIDELKGAGKKWTKTGRTKATKKVLKGKSGKAIKKAVKKRKRWFW